MSRNPSLRDWPECLKRLTASQLEDEHATWKRLSQTLGHPQARKGAAKYMRDVEKEMDRRESEE
jgi:hypothetical protein